MKQEVKLITSCFLLSSWSLGQSNSHLSYYDGLIQLTYSNGSQYNNEQHTLRSTLISFLCDPEAGAGNPEFQVGLSPPLLSPPLGGQCSLLSASGSPCLTVLSLIQTEDSYTYNFRWYTSYACPQRPHECLVTDPGTLKQYDLSR